MNSLYAHNYKICGERKLSRVKKRIRRSTGVIRLLSRTLLFFHDFIFVSSGCYRAFPTISFRFSYLISSSLPAVRLGHEARWTGLPEVCCAAIIRPVPPEWKPDLDSSPHRGWAASRGKAAAGHDDGTTREIFGHGGVPGT